MITSLNRLGLRRNILIIWLSLLPMLALAQQPGPASDSFNNKSDYAPTPKAQAVTEYGRLSPNLNTGALSFDIPIYTYQDQDFEIPIGLHYYSNGLRPASPSGEVGLGWTLMAGGAITREIVGVDDFGNGGRYGASYSSSSIYSLSSTVHYTNGVVTYGSNTQNETTSDIYHFTFGGHSGSFVIADNGTSYLVYGTSGEGKGTYTVSSSGSGVDTYFTITTGDGTQWRFGYDSNARERLSHTNGITVTDTEPESESDMSVVTWLLDRITAPDGRKAEFSYARDVENTNSIPTEGTDVLTTFSREYNGDYYKKTSMIYTTYLSSISVTGPSGSTLQPIAEFSWSSKSYKEIAGTEQYCYTKMVVKSKKLDSVTICAGSQTLRTANLTYTYSGQRPLLSQVSVSGVGNWSFTYNLPSSGGLPGQLTNSLDYWGYYNGATGTNDAYFIPTTVSGTGYDETIPAGNTFMDPNGNYAKQGTLSSVTWPTGGTTTVTWEANRAVKILLRRAIPTSPIIPEGEEPSSAGPYTASLFAVTSFLHSNECGGVRVASISNNDGIGAQSTHTYTYTDESGTSSGIVQHMNRYLAGMNGNYPVYNPYLKYPGSGFDASHIAYSTVVETYPDGSSVRTNFSSWEDTPDNYSPHNQNYNAGDVDPNSSEAYLLFVNNILREPNSRAYRRGLPKKTIKKDANGRIVEETVTTYVDVGADSVAYVCGSGRRWWSVIRNICDRRASSVTTTLYPASGSSLTSVVTSTYDALGRLSEKTETDWDGTARRSVTTWLSSTQTSAPKSLPASVSYWIRPASASAFTQTRADNYTWSQASAGSSLWNMTQSETRLYDVSGTSTMADRVSYSQFDASGNPCQKNYPGGRKEALLWGYEGRYPVARVQGATYASLPASVKVPISANLTTSQKSALRGLSDVLVETWDWVQGIGLSQATDPAGRSTSYTYDIYGRLTGESDALGALNGWSYSSETKSGITLKTIDQTTQNGSKPFTQRTVHDGLGREWLYIQRKGTGTSKDIGSFRYRDAMGRESRSYLPYAGTTVTAASAESQQISYWSVAQGSTEGSYAYAKRTYVEGPLSWLASETLPGSAFHNGNKKTSVSYRANLSEEVPKLVYNESIRKVTVDGWYSAGTLLCTGSSTADGEITSTFTNHAGQVVLERKVALNISEEYQDTYYVYDRQDRVAWVLTPGLGTMVRDAAGGMVFNLTENSENAQKWCYVYTYTANGLLGGLQTPGAGAGKTVYDSRHRPEREYPAHMESAGYYYRHNYDSLDRRTSVQLYKAVDESPSRNDRLIEIDTLVHNLSTVTYATSGSSPYGSVPSELAFQAVSGVVSASDKSNNVYGERILEKEWLLTGPYTEMPNPLLPGSGTYRAGVSDSYAQTAYYYDVLGRVIQTVRKEPDGGITRISYSYDRVGNVLATSEEHNPGGNSGNDWTLTENTWNNRGRLTATSLWAGHSTTVNKSSADVTATYTYTYDEIDQLTGSTLSSGSHQLSTSYSQTMQGWLSQAVSYVDGTETFREQLRYNNPQKNNTQARYGGSISEAVSTHAGYPARTEAYTYDKYGRLSSMVSYRGVLVPTSLANVETGFTYDPCGNLLSMTRYGASGTAVANLSLTRSGNRITQVNDSVGNSSWTYTYGDGGLLTYDGRQGTNLAWNVLGQTSGAGTRKRSFLAGGALYQEAFGTGNRIRQGSYVYRKKMSALGTTYPILSLGIPGGEVLNSSATLRTLGVYAHVTDHLGSIRAIVDMSTGSVVERNDYYPYGTKVTTNANGSSYPQLSLSTLGFSGKEEQDQTLSVDYLDFGARMYDAYTSSWTAPDPLATDYPTLGPWMYCAGNPVNLVDLEGMRPIYSTQGYLLGTDDEGLQGDAIIMDSQYFHQGMSPEEALKYNLGMEGLVDPDAVSRFNDSFNNLGSRPDWDGYLTLAEANDWYRNGNGQPLYVSLEKIDLSGLVSLGEDFVNGKKKVIHLFFSSASMNDAMVYGNITVKRYPNHSVRAYSDSYGFEMKPWLNPWNWGRNVETAIGKRVAGSGREYEINIYGSKRLTPILPWTIVR